MQQNVGIEIVIKSVLFHLNAQFLLSLDSEILKTANENNMSSLELNSSTTQIKMCYDCTSELQYLWRYNRKSVSRNVQISE